MTGGCSTSGSEDQPLAREWVDAEGAVVCCCGEYQCGRNDLEEEEKSVREDESKEEICLCCRSCVL